MSTEVDIQIPPGSVADLDAAAGWHARIAETLRQSQQTLVSNSFALATRWEGVAAHAYAEYSEHVVVHYGDAADQAEEVSHTISGWARTLEADQRRSRQLLAEAEAKAAAVDAARRTLATVTTSASASNSASTSAASASAASAIGADARRLASLEAELHELERQGAEIYAAAEQLAARHNAYLSAITVTPPALLQAPAPAPARASTSAVAIAPVAIAGAGAAIGAGSVVESQTGGADPVQSPAANLGVGGPTEVPTNLNPVSSGATQGAISFGDLEKIGHQFGWSASQDQAWWQVIRLESGGNPAATNPGSGAYGIGQFLGSTMKEYAPFGAASASPMDQLNAMARYIHDRYGSPDAALSFHLANNWY